MEAGAFFISDKSITKATHISEGFKYSIHRIVGGFDPTETFYEISAEPEEQSKETLLGDPAHYFEGYLQQLPEDG